eukprot:GFUD01029901.1.p1 GENE.GFUD01029901.1~~GFUD01029901.1.p1  ORF type:complete len:220 (+),score=34.14 GFUD01029901.1:221-880(+)
MARLLIVGVLCILMGIGGLIASFLVKQEQKTPWILRVAGGVLILISIFFFAFYICGGKKKKKRRGSTKMKRKRNPQEISRAYTGNENLAGPQHERGISVISPSGLNFTPNRHEKHPPSHHGSSRFAPAPAARHAGVMQNPGGRQDIYVHDGHARGSMDSINSALSFGSTISSSESHSNTLRSSLRQPKNRDTASLTSNASNTSSKKSVRLALGGEQTAV